MHEEDGDLGLWVESPTSEKWKAFVDGRLPGKDGTSKSTSTNIDQCCKALRQSIQEEHDAFRTKHAIQPSGFAAWQHAPVLGNVSRHPDNHAPLLKVESGRIYKRIDGPTSRGYGEISNIFQWMAFYGEHFSRVEGQVKLLVQRALKDLSSG
jgi:hypothetical protein